MEQAEHILLDEDSEDDEGEDFFSVETLVEQTFD